MCARILACLKPRANSAAPGLLGIVASRPSDSPLPSPARVQAHSVLAAGAEYRGLHRPQLFLDLPVRAIAPMAGARVSHSAIVTTIDVT